MTHRPDYSEYVAHFTSAVAIQDDVTLNRQIGPLTPVERLARILQEGRITATKKHFSLGRPSVAFTECPWTSLLDHATRYSSFGVGFTKQLLWEKGGQPALYMRSEYLKALKDHVETHAAHPVFPSIPTDVGALYTPIERDPEWPMLSGTTVQTRVDFAHEREWRVVGDLTFIPADVQFIVVDRFSDIAHLPQAWVRAIGEDRILSMSNYRRIMELWPP